MNEGDLAPEFELPDENGNMVKLSDFRGKYIVLYFYPRDNTSGCTREAKDFSEHIDEFEKLNAVVIGVSKDSQKSHRNFIEKHDLKVRLLSDTEHSVIEAYGAWKKKKLYGREYYGTERTTVLIGPDGRVLKVWRKVKVNGHVEDVLKYLKEIQKREVEE